jgi:hypothetical protein
LAAHFVASRMASMCAVHPFPGKARDNFIKIIESTGISCADWIATFGYLSVQCGKYGNAVGIV